MNSNKIFQSINDDTKSGEFLLYLLQGVDPSESREAIQSAISSVTHQASFLSFLVDSKPLLSSLDEKIKSVLLLELLSKQKDIPQHQKEILVESLAYDGIEKDEQFHLMLVSNEKYHNYLMNNSKNPYVLASLLNQIKDENFLELLSNEVLQDIIFKDKKDNELSLLLIDNALNNVIHFSTNEGNFLKLYQENASDEERKVFLKTVSKFIKNPIPTKTSFRNDINGRDIVPYIKTLNDYGVIEQSDSSILNNQRFHLLLQATSDNHLNKELSQHLVKHPEIKEETANGSLTTLITRVQHNDYIGNEKLIMLANQLFKSSGQDLFRINLNDIDISLFSKEQVEQIIDSKINRFKSAFWGNTFDPQEKQRTERFIDEITFINKLSEKEQMINRIVMKLLPEDVSKGLKQAVNAIQSIFYGKNNAQLLTEAGPGFIYKFIEVNKGDSFSFALKEFPDVFIQTVGYISGSLKHLTEIDFKKLIDDILNKDIREDLSLSLLNELSTYNNDHFSSEQIERLIPLWREKDISFLAHAINHPNLRGIYEKDLNLEIEVTNLRTLSSGNINRFIKNMDTEKHLYLNKLIDILSEKQINSHNTISLIKSYRQFNSIHLFIHFREELSGASKKLLSKNTFQKLLHTANKDGREDLIDNVNSIVSPNYLLELQPNDYQVAIQALGALCQIGIKDRAESISKGSLEVIKTVFSSIPEHVNNVDDHYEALVNQFGENSVIPIIKNYYDELPVIMKEAIDTYSGKTKNDFLSQSIKASSIELDSILITDLDVDFLERYIEESKAGNKIINAVSYLFNKNIFSENPLSKLSDKATENINRIYKNKPSIIFDFNIPVEEFKNIMDQVEMQTRMLKEDKNEINYSPMM